MAGRFEALADTVAPAVLLKATEVSRRLSEAGVPHALIGGLAVGIHGHPRATKDVDFLVGAEAFESMSPFLVYRADLNDLPEVGVVDLLAVPPEFPSLDHHLAATTPAEVPIIPVAGPSRRNGPSESRRQHRKGPRLPPRNGSGVGGQICRVSACIVH